ncbi:DUF4870 domain-containing protein [uncultured Microbulbifer sp.]|uniref:DUF4870 domain-containing protein n=1 Tax=uncultured Microbulbifer sp. TaxID=348147 RepID=UPI00344B49CD
MPGAGFVLPVIMWATTKDQVIEVDRHGKMIFNWMISLFIYSIISTILIILGVGLLGLLVLALINVIFILIGAVRANDGIFWRYPLSIRFFK